MDFYLLHALGRDRWEKMKSLGALEFLDSWDGPMRAVTVHWEEFPNGVRVTRDEKVRIPADWEYLPRQGRWGDYTVWMNEDYTKLYEYPGDGMDYTLYLTTAKG